MVHKTRAEAKANLDAAIAYIPARYTAGVEKADWLNPAKSEAAEANYASGVQKAVTKKSRQAGIAKVTNEEWKGGCKTKGAPIIGERIRGALGKYDANFGPMLEAVNSSVDALPSRTTDYMANINSRLVPTVKKWKEVAGKA